MHLFVVSDVPIKADPWTLEPFVPINCLSDSDALGWNGEEYPGAAETTWGGSMQVVDLLGSMDVDINAHYAALHKVADQLRRRGVLMIDHEHLLKTSTYSRGYGPPPRI